MSDFRPRIALIVDHPQRDLAGLVLTAFEFCQNGAVGHLVPAADRGRGIWALPSADFTDRTLEVGLARDRGDYLENNFGHSVTLS